METTKILGILNLTMDSFSDGGEFMDPESAKSHAKYLVESGADILDIGAQSSNPDSTPISPEEEWNRIERIWDKIQQEKWISTRGNRLKVSIDSFRYSVLEKAIAKGLDYWNDITALKNPKLLEILTNNKESMPQIIAMYSHNRENRAQKKSHLTRENIIDSILQFFDVERKKWILAGIPEEKIIYDPGMGFFLGDDPYLSIEVLKNIGKLKKELGRILISVSRKSFLGNIIGNKPPKKRGNATLAAELFAYSQGVDFIRTHEPLPIQEGIILYQNFQKLS